MDLPSSHMILCNDIIFYSLDIWIKLLKCLRKSCTLMSYPAFKLPCEISVFDEVPVGGVESVISIV